MKEFYDHDEWVDQLLFDNDRFDYRYIYDAYSLTSPWMDREEGLIRKTRTRTDGTVEYLIIDERKNHMLVVNGAQGLAELSEYLIQRFCPKTRDMLAWHDQQHEWFKEDLMSYRRIENNTKDKNRGLRGIFKNTIKRFSQLFSRHK